jgi:serine/threonine-protein kinase SRPK3
MCCQIYYLIFGELPYSWWGINALVEAMIDVFGELPPEWESKWEQMRSDATTSRDPGAGQWKQLSDWRLEKQFDKHVHEPQLKTLLPAIQGLTKLLPSDRISASDALQLIRDNCGNIEQSE